MSICAITRRLSLTCSSGLMRKRMLAPACVLFLHASAVFSEASAPQSFTARAPICGTPVGLAGTKSLSAGCGQSG